MQIEEKPVTRTFIISLTESELRAIDLVLNQAKLTRNPKDITGYTDLADGLAEDLSLYIENEV